VIHSEANKTVNTVDIDDCNVGLGAGS